MTRLSFLLVSEHQTGVDRNLSVCRRIIFYYPDDISLRITEMRLVPQTRYRPLRYNDTSPGCGNLFETGINRFILCGYQNSRIGVVLFSLQYFHEFPVHGPFLLRSASNPSNLPIFEFPGQVLFHKTPQPVPGHLRGSRNAQHST
jgi:hypothetical protein